MRPGVHCRILDEGHIKGKGTRRLTIGENTIDTSFDSNSDGKSYGYTPYKELISNPRNEKVVLEFTSAYPFSTRNVAMYSAMYESEFDIPSGSDEIRYDLGKMIDDFYDIDEIVYEGNADISRYRTTNDFYREGTKTLVLSKDCPGNFKVFYKAYPQHITIETPDDFELAIDPEVASLMPLYMASQLYKDDDSGIATVYRNEFEVALEGLKKTVKGPSSEKFTSESGWI